VHLRMIEHVALILLPENCVQVRLLSRFIAISAARFQFIVMENMGKS